MNMVFWMFVILALIILWFALRGLFDCIGRYINNVLNDTKEILESEDIEKESEVKGEVN